MFKTLKRAYPLIIDEGYYRVNIINLTLSVTVFLFLYIIQPKLFYVNFQYTLSTCFLFSGITLFISLFFTNVITRIFPSVFQTEIWTVGKEIFFVFTIVLTIAITNSFIDAYLFYPEEAFDFIRFLKVVLSTLIVSIIPLGVFVMISQRLSYNKLKTQSNILNSAIEEHKITTDTNTKLKLSGQGKYEELDLEINNLLYIESTGNYCDVIFLKGDRVQKRTFRITLKHLQQQINLPDTIIKTHRSYLVNLNHIIHAKGNAQGYQLSIKGIHDFYVPVSRANVDFINKKVQQF